MYRSPQQIESLKYSRTVFPTITPPPIENKPPSVLLDCPFVYNQLNLDSCTACALCMALLVMYPNITKPSVLYLYYKSRDHGELEEPSEADALDAITKYGVCSEACWPYDPSKSNVPPPTQCNVQASQNKAGRVGLVDSQSVTDMIASGIPVMMGIQIYSNFIPDANGHIGLPNGEYTGGHEVLIVGYNSDNLICINSWGSEWGKNGYFTIPKEYIQNPDWIYSLTCVMDFPV